MQPSTGDLQHHELWDDTGQVPAQQQEMRMLMFRVYSLDTLDTEGSPHSVAMFFLD